MLINKIVMNMLSDNEKFTIGIFITILGIIIGLFIPEVSLLLGIDKNDIINKNLTPLKKR